MIWDLEFKREKTLMIREDIRKEYDGACARLYTVDTEIAKQKKDPAKVCEVHKPEAGKEKVHKDKGKCACEYVDNHIPVGEIEGFYDKKLLLERDRDRFKEQMKGLDLDVYGSKKTNEFPDGLDGINQQLEALRELKGMLKQFIKTI